MLFQGIHHIWTKSGWLLSYGLKGVWAAMVARLARFLKAIQQTKKTQKRQLTSQTQAINYKDGNGQG